MSKFMRRLTPVLFITTAALWFLLFTPAASAQAKSVVVERRDGDITILKNGDVQVAETWVVHFEGGPFHTAFRALDLSRVENVSDIRVSEGDQAYNYNFGANTEAEGTVDVGATNKNLQIQWYFEPTTDGTRTFKLGYTLHGVVRVYPQGDQLWWQFIEANRGYPIRASHVDLHLPAAVGASELDLEAVPNSSARRVDDKTLSFEGGPFGANAGWEIRAQFPHRLVSSSAPAWQAADDELAAREAKDQALAQQIQFGQLAGGILVLVGGLLGALALNYTRMRQTPTALPVEFLTEPPDSLPPGLAGALVDGKADIQDIVATLVDLARRGFLKMTAQGADHAFDRADGGDPKTLHAWEQQLLETVFSVTTHRQLSDRTDQLFLSLYAPKIESAMADELVTAGYFTSPPVGNTRSPLFWTMTALFWGAIVYGVLSFFLFHNFSMLTLFDIVVVLIVTTVITRLDQSKPRTTPHGAEASTKWKAFKNYLKNISRYNVKEAQDRFEKYLPYAVAFGTAENWVSAFEAVDTPAPSWYQWQESAESNPPQASSSHTHAHGSGAGTGAPNAGALPSLNDTAKNSFRGLNDMSASFFTMLSTTATAFSTPTGTGSSDSSSGDRFGGSDSSSSSSEHHWSGGGSSGHASGGGSSGFG